MGSNINYRICAGCFRDKPSRAGKMLQHNRWSKRKRAMEPCPGSRNPPATREQLLKIGFRQVYNK